MKKTFFIADVHLSSQRPELYSLVIDFIDMVITERGDLYILGDLFDYWANNTILLRQNRPVFTKLAEMSAAGLQASFLFGNRDFLLRRETLEHFGVAYLGEEARVTIDSKQVFLTHGHTLCLSDTQFLAYKKRYWPLFRLLDRMLPGPAENYIARRFMLKSKEVIGQQEQSRFSFTRKAIDDLFDQGIDAVICGHVHREEAHGSGARVFYALPAWHSTAGYYLEYCCGDFVLRSFTATKRKQS